MFRIEAVVKFHLRTQREHWYWNYSLPGQVSFLANQGLVLTQITFVLNLNLARFVSHFMVQCIWSTALRRWDILGSVWLCFLQFCWKVWIYFGWGYILEFQRSCSWILNSQLIRGIWGPESKSVCCLVLNVKILLHFQPCLDFSQDQASRLPPVAFKVAFSVASHTGLFLKGSLDHYYRFPSTLITDWHKM
jgi:hypothetical protein